MASLDEQARRLGQAAAGILAIQAHVERASPWPLAELYGTEAEASWGPPELLAHLDEMLPYWLGEVERILASDPAAGPLPFGRIADDPIRIGIIGRDRRLPLRVLFERFDAASAGLITRMPELTSADIERVGVHPSRGELSVLAIFERFVVGHLEDHVVQLGEIVTRAEA